MATAPGPAPPDPDALERAARHAMPPLDRAGFVPGTAFAALLDGLLDRLQETPMPVPARAALDRVAAADQARRAAMVANVLADAIPFEEVAEHALVAAACQVAFAGMAAGLDPAAVKPVADGVCPVCGGAPVASLIVGWREADRSRYCACALCGTLWNHVRARCTLCGETRAISFREVEGGGGRVKAECCDDCHGYVKVLYQNTFPELEPFADDVASLALDLLVREEGFRRGAVNPFLTGY